MKLLDVLGILVLAAAVSGLIVHEVYRRRRHHQHFATLTAPPATAEEAEHGYVLPTPKIEIIDTPPVCDAALLPAPGTHRDECPVCGWRPCTDSCRLGLNQYDLERLGAYFDDFTPPGEDCDG